MVSLVLKNAAETVLMDQHIFDELRTDAYLSSIDFFNNLRRHSSGCVVFQKTYRKPPPETGYRTETIYLHKLLAEKYLSHQRTEERKLVGCKNGNKLDCRLANLEYRSRAVASRKRKTSSKAGYTGVYQENKRYRAVISKDRRSIHIGMYATPEEAAMAYNAKSLELFGKEGKLNVLPPHASSDEGTPGGKPHYRNTEAPQPQRRPAGEQLREK